MIAGSLLRRLSDSLLASLPTQARVALFHRVRAALPDEAQLDCGLVNMFGSIANLRRNGFSPRTVIDVGAFEGGWTTKVAPIFPDARLHMVEAQPAMEPRLREVVVGLGGRCGLTSVLLGATARDGVPFHCLRTGSSVFEELSGLPATTVPLPMRTLDEVVASEALKAPYFLKLDVQGYELEVLAGASGMLSGTEAILLETALLQYNRGAPLLAEVVAFMNERGFVAYDICGEMLRRQSDRALFQTDFLFVRRDHALRADRPFYE